LASLPVGMSPNNNKGKEINVARYTVCTIQKMALLRPVGMEMLVPGQNTVNIIKSDSAINFRIYI
jgi:hypothetical protein